MELPTEVPIYVQLISGTILGLALANLLAGAAKFVQQPQTHRFNILHALWVTFILGAILVFWWQEGLNFANVQWTFPLYLFQVVYCATFLFMTAVLLPDTIGDHASHYDYFIARRHWFYGALIVSYLLGIGDELVKQGWDEIFIDPTYIVMNAVVVGMLVAGMVFNRRWLHIAIASFLVLMVIGAMLVE